MLLVGEVRDGETAGELVRAAVNGTLVLTTIHASDPKTAVARLSALASQTLGRDSANDLVASAVRLVFHQKLTLVPHESAWRRGRLSGEVLINPHDASPAANNIRDGAFAQLNHTLAAQSRILSRFHRPPFTEIVKEL
jgi:twitching motility protein PilT